jgi:DNA-binding MarR family transcriptional regulator
MLPPTLQRMDDLERGFARWKSERRSLDTGTLACSARLVRLARFIELGRREVLADLDLEVWEFDVLAALRTSDTALPPGWLMAHTQVASGTMTNRVTRLDERGFVTRRPDPDDGRGVLVQLTAAGRKKVDLAAAEVATAEAVLWNNVGVRKRDQINAVLSELLQDFDQ